MEIRSERESDALPLWAQSLPAEVRTPLPRVLAKLVIS
jgi:hypothetical protein